MVGWTFILFKNLFGIYLNLSSSTLTKNKLKTIPYLTRMIKVDRVGFEPTTSAIQHVFYLSFNQSCMNKGSFKSHPVHKMLLFLVQHAVRRKREVISSPCY